MATCSNWNTSRQEMLNILWMMQLQFSELSRPGNSLKAAFAPAMLLAIKLMRLGSPNQIDNDSDSKAVDFDRRITSIRLNR